MLNHTIVFAVLSLAPMAALFVAFAVAAILAAFIRAASEGSYVPEASAVDSATWIESFESLDIEAEWCETIAAAVSILDKRAAFLSSAREGIKAAAARIAHPATRTTVPEASPLSTVKLASGNRKLTSVACPPILPSDQACYAERTFPRPRLSPEAAREIEATILMWIEREWCEAYREGFNADREFVRFESLGTLASLAASHDDSPEAAAAWGETMRAFDETETEAAIVRAMPVAAA